MSYYYGQIRGVTIVQLRIEDPNTEILAVDETNTNQIYSGWTAYADYVGSLRPSIPGNAVRVPIPGVHYLLIDEPGFGTWYIPGNQYILFKLGNDIRIYKTLKMGITPPAMESPPPGTGVPGQEGEGGGGEGGGSGTTTTNPPAPGRPPDPQDFDVTIIEGLRVGEATIKSTGRVPFQQISGWNNSERAEQLDDAVAHHEVTAGYTTRLVATNPMLTLPRDAVVTGIKVYVRRRRV